MGEWGHSGNSTFCLFVVAARALIFALKGWLNGFNGNSRGRIRAFVYSREYAVDYDYTYTHTHRACVRRTCTKDFLLFLFLLGFG